MSTPNPDPKVGLDGKQATADFKSEKDTPALIFSSSAKEIESAVNKTYKFSQNRWVISIVNSKGNTLLSGHAVMVIEGIDEKLKLFRWEYDITANAPENMPDQNSLNQKGFITKIRGPNEGKAVRDYTNNPKVSYYFGPDDVKIIVEEIKKDAIQTEKAMANLNKEDAQKERDENGKIYELLRYQKLGKDHILVKLFGDDEHGNNCAGWCYEKLGVSKKPKPPINCQIM